MSQFAVLNENSLVIDIIVADSLEVAQEITGKQCIPCDPSLGVTANYGNFVWNNEKEQFINTLEGFKEDAI